MIYFDYSISPCFKATAAQGAPFTSLSFITGTLSNISAGGFIPFGSYTIHVLSHGTNVIILLNVVIQAFRMKWVGNITGTLLFMKEVVFDKGLYPVLLHKPIVLLRTITGICNSGTGKSVIALSKGIKERNKRECIRWIWKESEIGNKLILCCYLQVVSGFGLTIVHGVFLHAH